MNDKKAGTIKEFLEEQRRTGRLVSVQMMLPRPLDEWPSDQDQGPGTISKLTSLAR